MSESQASESALDYRVVDDGDFVDYPVAGADGTLAACTAWLESLASDGYPVDHLRIQAARPQSRWVDVDDVALLGRTPPEGWDVRGTHASCGAPVIVSIETDAEGLPLWERRPIGQPDVLESDESRAACHAMIEAAVDAIEPNVTNRTHAYNVWNNLASDPRFTAAIIQIAADNAAWLEAHRTPTR